MICIITAKRLLKQMYKISRNVHIGIYLEAFLKIFLLKKNFSQSNPYHIHFPKGGNALIYQLKLTIKKLV